MGTTIYIHYYLDFTIIQNISVNSEQYTLETEKRYCRERWWVDDMTKKLKVEQGLTTIPPHGSPHTVHPLPFLM